MNHFIAIACSNRHGSTNKKFIKFMKERYAKVAEIEILDIGNLPVYYKTPDHTIPEAAQEMGKKIAAADGVIISTPEYDHAVPAVLMNALAWLSYTIHPFRDKPVMVTGASYGTLGTSRAQQILRKMLASPELAARTMSSSEYMLDHSLQAFDEHGELKKAEFVDLLDQIFVSFETFVKQTREFQLEKDHALEEIRQLELGK